VPTAPPPRRLYATLGLLLTPPTRHPMSISSSELNFNLGLALIGWLGARNDINDGLFLLSSSDFDQGGPGIGSLSSCTSGSLATFEKQVVVWSIGAALAKLTWDPVASYVR